MGRPGQLSIDGQALRGAGGAFMSLATLQRLQREVGQLLERHDRGRDLSELEVYRGRPIDFAREVLGVTFWGAQEELSRATMTDRRLCLVGANSVGKDFACAVLALYAAFVEGALVLITAASQRQTREIAMATIRRLWSRSDLPGEAFVEALRIPGLEEGGILAFTSTESGRYTGFHAAKVWAVLMEAQALPEHAFEGLFSCATGPEDRVIVHGNPLFPVGRFVQLAKSDGWRTFTIPATSHPNIVEGRTVVPGGPSAEWIEHMAATYGATSNLYRSRVEALFPSQSEDGLISVEMLAAAAERCEALLAEHEGEEAIAALDPARLGADASALVVRRGPAVVAMKKWRKLDTSEIVSRLQEKFREHHIRPSREEWLPEGRRGWLNMPTRRRGGRGRIVVDMVGVGSGHLDALRALGYRCEAFNAGWKARDDRRFGNRRAEVYWHLRDLLAEGLVGIPQDEDLWTELLAVTWSPDAGGRVALPPKDTLRDQLGRSPDVSDALVMVFSGYKTAYGPPRLEPVYFSN
ncbi:MAG: hypothetical protein ACREMD_00935 [Gemmatimonadota bacterium]